MLRKAPKLTPKPRHTKQQKNSTTHHTRVSKSNNTTKPTRRTFGVVRNTEQQQQSVENQNQHQLTEAQIINPNEIPLPLSLTPTVAPNNLPANIDPLSKRVSPAPPRQTIFNLMGWVHKNGGKLHESVFYGSMNILRDKTSTDTGNWRGLALNDIQPGEILAEVPLSLCIFPLEKSFNPKTKIINGPQDDNFYTGLHGVLTAIPPQQWQLRLGTRLLAERATENSFFQPYIDALPQHYPTFPIFFNQQTAQTLSYQPMLAQLNRQSQRLGQLSKQLTLPHKLDQETGESVLDSSAPLNSLQKSSLLVFNNQEIQIGDLAWSEASVSSRAFDCPLQSSQNGTGIDANRTSIDGIDAAYSYQKCLVPLIDMLNHSFTPNCTVTFKYEGDKPFDPDDVECRANVRAVLKATEKINRGHELTISYFKKNEHEIVPKMPIKITDQNKDQLSKEIENCDDINVLFQKSLIRVPNVTPDGLQSTINNDRLFEHFGFIPGFNYRDDIVLNPDQSLFDTALEMSHDITVAHSYLAGKLSTSASHKVSIGGGSGGGDGSENNKNNQTKIHSEKENTSTTNNGITIGSIDDVSASIQKRNEINGSTAPTEITQAMFGEENTFDSALVKLLLPTAKQRSEDQSLLLMSLFQHNPTLSLNWGGPNETLLGICRIIAAGTHNADKNAVEDENLSQNMLAKNIEQEVVAKLDSETKIQGAIEHKISQVFTLAEQRSRVAHAMEGVFLPEDEELTGAQLFKGFTNGPIDRENEIGAMLVLYHALVVASAGFRTGMNKNVEGFYKASLAGNVGEATANLYARSKKMLMAHAMKTLATRIGLDNEANKIHNWHKRLDGM
jgi:hypothetical protein